jgi:hypothetical protein
MDLRNPAYDGPDGIFSGYGEQDSHKPICCTDYRCCRGCPAIETCEAFAETEECEEDD